MRLFILRTTFLLGAVFYTLPAVSEGELNELADDELHECAEVANHAYSHVSCSSEFYDLLGDEKEVPSARALKRGETIGEVMGVAAPVLKYGVPIGAGIAFVFLGFVSGGTAAIPLVFCVPVIAALGNKFSNMVLRIPELALEPETSAAYKMAIQKKGYKDIPSLPFESWVVRTCRKVKRFFE